jgi:NADH:ubiquinone oxidoreductase subunit 6 (subunit J)
MVKVFIVLTIVLAIIQACLVIVSLVNYSFHAEKQDWILSCYIYSSAGILIMLILSLVILLKRFH